MRNTVNSTTAPYVFRDFKTDPTLFPLDPSEDLIDESNLEEGTSADDRRVLTINLYFDTSLSVSHKEAEIREAFKKYLNNLADLNKESVDVRFKVTFTTFAETVKPIMSVPGDPEELLKVVGDDVLKCNGKSTNVPALLNAINEAYTRGGAVVSSLHAGDYKSLTIVETDFASTRSQAENEAAKQLLLSNQIYTKANETLVIYLGDASHKKDAELIAMNPENIIALGDDLDIDLHDLLLQSSLMFVGESTHLRGKHGDSSVDTVIHHQKERSESNDKDNVTDTDLQNALYLAFGLTPNDVNV